MPKESDVNIDRRITTHNIHNTYEARIDLAQTQSLFKLILDSSTGKDGLDNETVTTLTKAVLDIQTAVTESQTKLAESITGNKIKLLKQKLEKSKTKNEHELKVLETKLQALEDIVVGVTTLVASAMDREDKPKLEPAKADTDKKS